MSPTTNSVGWMAAVSVSPCEAYPTMWRWGTGVNDRTCPTGKVFNGWSFISKLIQFASQVLARGCSRSLIGLERISMASLVSCILGGGTSLHMKYDVTAEDHTPPCVCCPIVLDECHRAKNCVAIQAGRKKQAESKTSRVGPPSPFQQCNPPSPHETLQRI